MAAKAVTLEVIFYQLQQETVYYLAELDPVKKAQHLRNIQHLYGLLTTILKSKAPGIKVYHPLPPPPPPPSATV